MEKSLQPRSEPEDNSTEDVFYSLSSAVSDITLSASEPQPSNHSLEAMPLSSETVVKAKGIKIKFKPKKLLPKQLRYSKGDGSSDTTPESSQALVAAKERKEIEKSPSDSEIKEKKRKKKPFIMRKFGFGRRSKVAPSSMDGGTTSSSTTPGSVKRQTPEGATLSFSEQNLSIEQEAPTNEKTLQVSEIKHFRKTEQGETSTPQGKKQNNKVSGVKLQNASNTRLYNLDRNNKNANKADHLPTPPPIPPTLYTPIPLKTNKPISSTKVIEDPISDAKGAHDEKPQCNSFVAAIKKETSRLLNITKSNSDITPSLRAPAVPYNISELEIAHILDCSSPRIFNELPKEVPVVPLASIESTDSEPAAFSSTEYSEYIKQDRKEGLSKAQIKSVFTLIGSKDSDFMKREVESQTSTSKPSPKNEQLDLTQDEKVENIVEKVTTLIPTVHVQQAKVPYQVSHSSHASASQEPHTKNVTLINENQINFRIGTPVRPTKTFSTVTHITDSISIDDSDKIAQQELNSCSLNSQNSPMSDGSSRRKIKYEPTTSVEEQDFLEPGSFGQPNSYLSDQYSLDYSLNPLNMSTNEENQAQVKNMTNSNEKREHLYKILVIGELGCGKTSFIKRYVHQFFSQNYRATIGVDFALKVLNWDPNTIIRLQLWDIAGQERFGNMTRVYYKEAVGAFIVFDVTRTATFDAVIKWKQDLDSKVQSADGSPIPCILLANKCDQQKQGIVTTPSKLDDYVRENGFAGWYETSAKENINIDESAKALVNKILANDKQLNGNDLENESFAIDGRLSNAAAKSSCSC